MAKIKVRRLLAKDAKADNEHGLSVSNECARICNAFVGSAPESSTDNQLAGAFGNMALQQGLRGVDRGRHQSFFALNAPQGNPFAAAGVATLRSARGFEQSRTSVQEYPISLQPKASCSSSPGSSLAPQARRTAWHSPTQTALEGLIRVEVPAGMVVALVDSPRALVALESQLVRLCEICTVCLGLNGVQVNSYSVELAHSFELRLQRNRDFYG
ncbi:mei2-like protein [Fusarium globosum]|uniref:Mei2-like protein n=1 Tax=Fusarium globosum TaxID=78864 RepID=A0A8H5Y2J4_9HYPO|nr:mei2-like protein [Fusarium globosum]